jgi:hypothetical protein
MSGDYGLLSDLHDLKDSRIQEYLEEKRRDVVTEWTEADSDRAATLAQGKKRILDAILKDIATAWDQVRDQRERRERPRMSKAF